VFVVESIRPQIHQELRIQRQIRAPKACCNRVCGDYRTVPSLRLLCVNAVSVSCSCILGCSLSQLHYYSISFVIYISHSCPRCYDSIRLCAGLLLHFFFRVFSRGGEVFEYFCVASQYCSATCFHGPKHATSCN